MSQRDLHFKKIFQFISRSTHKSVRNALKFLAFVRSHSRRATITLLAISVLLPVVWFYVSLTRNAGVFNPDYKLELTAPLTSSHWFRKDETYVVFSQELPGSESIEPIEFSIRSRNLKNGIPVLPSSRHVELANSGNIIKSFARFRVPLSGAYELKAQTSRGQLIKLQIRSEAPASEKAEGMPYAFIISVFLAGISLYIQKPEKVSKMGRLVRHSFSLSPERLPGTFTHLNSKLRIETRQRFEPPSAINATRQMLASAKSPKA